MATSLLSDSAGVSLQVYTHQPVADIGAFAPRAYSEDVKDTPADRWNHVRKQGAVGSLLPLRLLLLLLLFLWWWLWSWWWLSPPPSLSSSLPSHPEARFKRRPFVHGEASRNFDVIGGPHSEGLDGLRKHRFWLQYATTLKPLVVILLVGQRLAGSFE